jgi:hypothetical protein
MVPPFLSSFPKRPVITTSKCWVFGNGVIIICVYGRDGASWTHTQVTESMFNKPAWSVFTAEMVRAGLKLRLRSQCSTNQHDLCLRQRWCELDSHSGYEVNVQQTSMIPLLSGWRLFIYYIPLVKFSYRWRNRHYRNGTYAWRLLFSSWDGSFPYHWTLVHIEASLLPVKGRAFRSTCTCMLRTYDIQFFVIDFFVLCTDL